MNWESRPLHTGKPLRRATMGPARGRLQPRAAPGLWRRGCSSLNSTIYFRRSPRAACGGDYAHRDVISGHGTEPEGVGTAVTAERFAGARSA